MLFGGGGRWTRTHRPLSGFSLSDSVGRETLAHLGRCRSKSLWKECLEGVGPARSPERQPCTLTRGWQRGPRRPCLRLPVRSGHRQGWCGFTGAGHPRKPVCQRLPTFLGAATSGPPSDLCSAPVGSIYNRFTWPLLPALLARLIPSVCLATSRSGRC